MIYVHIPYCRSFCTYCDFYSEVAAKCSTYEGFSSALSAEIASREDEIRRNIQSPSGVNTLYIGGGTPSVLPLSVFSSLLSSLENIGCPLNFDEFTVEVNPEDIVEKGHRYVEGLVKLGVDRISMGVQSFDDETLKWMNRRHDSARARQAYAILEEAGVKNISIDLIFGLPQLSHELWEENLSKALAISPTGMLPSHISSYQLSVEEGSALAALMAKGRRLRMRSARDSMRLSVKSSGRLDTIITKYLTLLSLVTRHVIIVLIGIMSRMSVLVRERIAMVIWWKEVLR